MRMVHIAACLVLAACSSQASAEAEYDALLDCEMRVLVVANFTPSLGAGERASMRGRLAALSEEMLEKAASLGKSTATIAADQKRRLLEVQERMRGPDAEQEAKRLIEEARRCVS